MKTKICSKCLISKSLIYFHQDKNRPDGLSCQCKFCVKKQGKKYYNKHKNTLKYKEKVIRRRLNNALHS